MKAGKGQQSKHGRAREGVRKGMSVAQGHWTVQRGWGSCRFASAGMF